MRDYDAIKEALTFYAATAETTRKTRALLDAADAIEELVAAVPHWISVEERLPEDFQKVLVFWWEHSEPMVDTAFWQKDAKRFDGEHWVRMEDKVTHWMPLPAPPKEETK